MYCCRREDWAGASPIAKGTGSSHKTRRVNLLEDGAYDASMNLGRRIRKPLDNDFLYYGSASNTGELLIRLSLKAMHSVPRNVFTSAQCS